LSTYANATFYARIPDGLRPGWEQEPNISVRHLPFANQDDMQAMGRGNYRLTVPARLDDDSAIGLLQAAVGATARTLTDYYGATYSNVYLVAVSNPQRLTGQTTWFVNLEFLRAGA
jgi:hypothetical protein